MSKSAVPEFRMLFQSDLKKGTPARDEVIIYDAHGNPIMNGDNPKTFRTPISSSKELEILQHITNFH